ncbi:MAG: DUF523 domain-containing protein [Clostridia bacterium]|nr:DUF523 domain-containing protein [Clostridia bacterium]MBQ6796338.1 DUF523 domain-containing protein [Clostridia bacterium]
MDNLLISACLLGLSCRYDGEYREYDLKNLREKFNLIPICPEIYGGLPTPRVPSEIQGEKVVNRNGEDVTAQYEKGAQEALKLAKLYNAKYALLKAKSPSCGKNEVYDGSFTATLVSGEGVTAKLLRENELVIFTENEINILLEK